MDADLPQYAGTIIDTGCGILCQLRDDKPDIDNPGCWCSSPGGRIHTGETPREAAIRELWEEFEIHVSELQPFLVETVEDGQYRGIYHIFRARLTSPVSAIQCHEGQAASIKPLTEALSFKQHPVAELAIQRYAAR